MPLTSLRLTIVVALLGAYLALAQTAAMTAIPLIRLNGSTAPGPAVQSIAFSIYAEQRGGSPLWQELQTVNVDDQGRYSVLLGSTSGEGLPRELLSSGEARWLSVNTPDALGREPERILLTSGSTAARPVNAQTPESGQHTTLMPSTGGFKLAHAAPRVSSGSPNYVALFTDGAGDLSNSVLYQSGASIGLGTTAPRDYFHIAFNDTTGGVTGYAVQNLGGGASSYSGMLFYDQNGALGQFQGFNNSSHEYRINNIAANGSINFMLGSSSKFQVRSDGDINISGSVRKGGTLFLHNLGSFSTAIGLGALAVNIGSQNTAVGYQALANTSSGASNIGVGASAGSNITTSSNNIDIGNAGVAGDSGTIRIGVQGTHTKTFVAGISGVTVTGGAAVLVDANGQLGSLASSRRFKTDIEEMGDASSNLFKLRPVTFHYKEHPNDRLEYGLIAEEVAEVYPDLIVKSADGQFETVQYHKLTPMLLNELQKERLATNQKLHDREEALKQQEELNRALQKRLTALEKLLAR